MTSGVVPTDPFTVMATVAKQFRLSRTVTVYVPAANPVKTLLAWKVTPLIL